MFRPLPSVIVPVLVAAAFLLPSRSVPQHPQQPSGDHIEQNEAYRLGYLPRTVDAARELAKRNGIKGIWTEVYHENGA